MKSKRNHAVTRGTAAALCVLTVIGTVNVTVLACRRVWNRLLPAYQEQQKLYGKLGEIQKLIDTYYVGEYQEQDMMDMASLGMVVGTGDRWSSYLSADKYGTYRLNQKGEMVGIGISVIYNEADQSVRVREVYENSPAEKAGIEKGDFILQADDVVLEETDYQSLVEAIRGTEGTSVTLYICHEAGQTPEKIAVKRAKINKTVVHVRMLENQIGYIALDDFDGGADTQFLDALQTLQEKGAQAFIFDVRYNPGGLITVLTNILDPLLPEGDIVTLRAKDGTEKKYTSDAAALDLPMAVLVNSESISAAELFAAALQEYGAAVVVGTKTIGKGYAQRTYQLSDGSAVVLSDQKYYTPKGKNLADIGIEPDIVVEMSEEKTKNFYELTDAEDDQLQAAIEAVCAK